MKVGILTFHWATNYGAVLQCLALQDALRTLGHDVRIINYKPRQYDNNLWTFIRFRKFLNLKTYYRDIVKETKLEDFRRRYLNLTSSRYYSWNKFRSELSAYDVLISGSDQVMNPSFLFHGEVKGSTAYFLDIDSATSRRVAYAVSFGTTSYPEAGIKKAKQFIPRFCLTSTREKSGLSILHEMGAKSPVLVPDPTLLHKESFYDRLLTCTVHPADKCSYAYMLRKRDVAIRKGLGGVRLISDESIEEWLALIRSANHFITNSFHGVVFSIIFHTPFTVVLKTKENVGMNDRFFTLLEPLGLADRIVSEEEFNNSKSVFDKWDWDEIDARLNRIREQGWNFLKQI